MKNNSSNLKKLTAAVLTSCYLTGAIPYSTQNVKAVNIITPIKDVIIDSYSQEPILTSIVLACYAPGVYKLGKWLWEPFTQDYVIPFKRWCLNTFVYNRKKLSSDPVKFSRKATEYLNKYIFAQPRAVDKVVDILSGYIDLWNQGTSNNMSNIGACGMVLIGDSGTGKTYTAQLLSLYLFGKSMEPWQFISASSIPDLNSDFQKQNINVYFNSFGKKQNQDETPKEKPSPADRLFNTKSALFRQLCNNRHVIIFLDEADKIHKKDTQDTILERLRDAKDTGILKFYVKDNEYVNINVQGTCFIISSNEYPQCWGLPEKNLTPAQAAARTMVQRDKSLVNRFEVIEYDNFKDTDYNLVLHKLVPTIKKDFLKNYHVHLDFSNNFFELVSKSAENKNKGIRGLNDYLVLLRGSVIKYCAKNNITKNNLNRISLNVEYDDETDTFSLTK